MAVAAAGALSARSGVLHAIEEGAAPRSCWRATGQEAATATALEMRDFLAAFQGRHVGTPLAHSRVASRDWEDGVKQVWDSGMEKNGKAGLPHVAAWNSTAVVCRCDVAVVVTVGGHGRYEAAKQRSDRHRWATVWSRWEVP